MAGSRSLGTLTIDLIDLIARVAGFEQGMDKAERSLDKRTKRMSAIAKKAGTAIGTALAAGAVAATAAVVSWSREMIQLAGEVDRLSKLSNTGAVEFQKWAAAAEFAGVEQDKLAAKTGFEANRALRRNS